MRLRGMVSICILLGANLATLAGAPIAENTYAKIQSMDLFSTSMETIITEYDNLYQQVSKIAGNAIEDMTKARETRDMSAYNEAYERYTSLAKYAMDQETSDRLLARILEEPEDHRVSHAAWLYEHSDYYRPVLSIDFSLSGEGYRYSFSQRLQQKPGSPITLPDASQILVDAHDTGILAGWGMTEESVDFEFGETITMPLINQTLYAIWSSAIKLVDNVNGTEELLEDILAGKAINLPVPTPPSPEYRFIGWLDRSTKTLLKNPESYTVTGKGAVLEALWKELTIEAVNTLYFGFDRLPRKTQIGVGFSISNQGNVPLKGLKASLSAESPHITFLTDTITVKDLLAGTHRTNNSRYATRSQGTITGEANTFRFVISEETPSGTNIPFTLTITDADGEKWETQVSFTVR